MRERGAKPDRSEAHAFKDVTGCWQSFPQGIDPCGMPPQPISADAKKRHQ
jgi:hypothetical protein